jgi:hypothetical protein
VVVGRRHKVREHDAARIAVDLRGARSLIG